jgi:hypothetical protein
MCLKVSSSSLILGKRLILTCSDLRPTGTICLGPEKHKKNEIRDLRSKNEVMLSLGGGLGCAGEAASPHVRSKVQLGVMQGRNLRCWSNCFQPSSHSHSYIKVVFEGALHFPFPHSTSLHILSVFFFPHNNCINQL